MTSPILPLHVEHLVRKHGAEEGPWYLYDPARVRASCRRFRAVPHQPASIHFACMANPNPEFLAAVREEGVDVFVNSPAHLRSALALGFSGERVVFAASAMDEASMRLVAGCGVRVVLDSPGQVVQWKRACSGTPFAVRCNVASAPGGLVEPRSTRGGFFIGRESRLGLATEELAQLRGDRLVNGLHVYVGTDLSDLDYFRRCYQALAGLADGFPGLAFLDLGGGFAVEDEEGRAFPIEALVALAADVVEGTERRLGRRLGLVLEPGRILGADAGWFVCRVTDVKVREGRQLVGVNASVAQFPRPLFYPETARHPVTLLPAGPREGTAAAVPSDVCGCSTYSRDFLAREVALPRARPGDLVVIGKAGAYCAALHTSFLGFPPAREVFHERADDKERGRAAALPLDRAAGSRGSSAAP